MTTRRSTESCRASDPSPTPQAPSAQGALDVDESGTFASGSGSSPDSLRLQRRAPSDPTARLAHRLHARVLRPNESARVRGSLGTMSIPDDVLLLPDGCAIASYEGEPLLRYRSLLHLCQEHGLGVEELEEC